MRPSGSPSASISARRRRSCSSRSRSPGICSPSARAHARSQQAAQRVVEVAAGQEVVGQARQQVVGVEVGELLGAVPPRVVVPAVARSSSPTVLLAPAVEGAGARGVLVQPLGQVQALEEELQGAGHERRRLGLAASGPASARVGGSSSGMSASTAR